MTAGVAAHIPRRHLLAARCLSAAIDRSIEDLRASESSAALRMLLLRRSVRAQHAYDRRRGGVPENNTRGLRYVKTLQNLAGDDCTDVSDLTRSIHRSLLQSDQAGEFRSSFMAVRGATGADSRQITVPPHHVETEMKGLDALATSASTLPLVRIALVHYALLKIHPFTDANGRVARALSAHQLSAAYGFQLLVDSTPQLIYTQRPYNGLLRLQHPRSVLPRWTAFFGTLLALELEAVKLMARGLGQCTDDHGSRDVRHIEQCVTRYAGAHGRRMMVLN
jgi:fido (protein-threonine AMPylation protein)